jgi:hypothetical protein
MSEMMASSKAECKAKINRLLRSRLKEKLNVKPSPICLHIAYKKPNKKNKQKNENKRIKTEGMARDNINPRKRKKEKIQTMTRVQQGTSAEIDWRRVWALITLSVF